MHNLNKTFSEHNHPISNILQILSLNPNENQVKICVVG